MHYERKDDMRGDWDSISNHPEGIGSTLFGNDAFCIICHDVNYDTTELMNGSTHFAANGH